MLLKMSLATCKFLCTSSNFFLICFSNWHLDCAKTKWLMTVCLISYSPQNSLNSWKFHVLVFTLLLLLFNCLLQAILFLAWWEWKWTATASLVTNWPPQDIRSLQLGHFISTYQKQLVNFLDHVDLYYCEEMGLTQIKVLLLTGVFYVDMYGIRWPVSSNHPQNFVKSHAFTTGKTAVYCDTLEWCL